MSSPLAPAPQSPAPPRLFVLTDITSIDAGVREPDDAQSLVRLLLYADEIEIEGLCATSGLGHGHVCRPENVAALVDAYARDWPNLIRHDVRYTPPEQLRAVIGAGHPVAGKDVPAEECIGKGRDSEASEALIRAVDRDDPHSRPLWVAAWGGTCDLAQALWRVRATRSEEETARFVSKLRVHAIHDQDTTGAWMRAEFPALFNIARRTHGMRGMYRGGDTSLVSSEWVRENAHGHGALGEAYPDYHGGDIWGRRLGPVNGIKEGDTPSFLPLLDNGLGRRPGGPEVFDPGLGSWGGRFVRDPAAPGLWTEAADGDVPGCSDDPDPHMGAVHRWRAAFQNDFAARLDRCAARAPGGVNRPPVVRIEGGARRAVAPGERLTLDASGSSDPDGGRLTFSWSLYPPPPDGSGGVYGGPGNVAGVPDVLHTEGPLVHILLPEDTRAPATLDVLLAVTDDGTPPLTRYGRVRIDVRAGKQA